MTLPAWYRNTLRAADDLGGLRRFFIIGCQKSGTTWMQALCNAHPALACSGEGHFTDVLSPLMMQACKAFNEQDKATGKLTPDEILSAVRLLIDARMREYLPRESGALGAIEAVGDKTPEAAVGAMLLDRLFPGSRFIHIVRDGRDCIASGWAHLQRAGQAGGFASLAEYAAMFTERHWAPYITMARSTGAQLGDRYLEVRYEDMLESPAEWAGRVFQFLGVDDSASVLAESVDRSSFRAMSGGRAPGQADEASHFRKGVAGDWRGSLDARAVEAFERIGGDLARELGYDVGAHAA